MSRAEPSMGRAMGFYMGEAANVGPFESVSSLMKDKLALEAELKGLYDICYALEAELSCLKARLVIDQAIVIRRPGVFT